MARITLSHVDKRYPNGFVASRDLSLEVADGEFLVLVGPSGSGKSTVLRMIAGLEKPTGGTIAIGERDVTRLPPQERDIAMVFQSYALYPHMTVRENMAFGLRLRKQSDDMVARRIGEVADALGLASMLDRKPAQLSGGQRQRVALGRAIVREPKAFLFDEPLSNLDAQLRVETRAELARLHRRLGATMVYVTHDQVEAMTLGTRVAVLKDGVLQQIAPPMELYRQPRNQFVASFIGSPSMNFVRGTIERENERARFVAPGVTIALSDSTATRAGPVVLGVRPHDISLGAAADTGVSAVVTLVEPLGSEQLVYVRVAGGADLVAAVGADRAPRIEETVALRVAPNAVHLFDPEHGSRLALGTQQPAASTSNATSQQ
ncbi:MAG TPA: ABC transporter ATP-binding protein [Gemmatimonadaceae bacterium]|jgi:multiple sugar transport system ATP-binding protein